MKPNLSVIICTHNPRKDYLERVLKALQQQTLSRESWELLLIDNASDNLLEREIDLKWHPQSRHIREEQLGLTPARLRGIKESVSETLVFVDDDNILDPDYLEVAWQISKNYSFIGAWGGRIRPAFEIQPPEWTKPYWEMLAIRDFEQDKWSNLPHWNETTPCGAGLCIRKLVAKKYADLVCSDPRRINLDRKGNSLISCGDSDLALTACDIGLGTGMFTSLTLTHLMPTNRLTEEYLLRLVHGIYYSVTILGAIRGIIPVDPCRSQKIYQDYLRWRMDRRSKRFYDAMQEGKKLAMQEIATWNRENIKNQSKNHK